MLKVKDFVPCKFGDKLWAPLMHPLKPMSNKSTTFWSHMGNGRCLPLTTLCFPHLFPYGDGLPGTARPSRFADKLWIKHLLLRSDRSAVEMHWGLGIDFVAVAFSVFHRRDLLRAVHVRISNPSFAHCRNLLENLREIDFQQLSLVLQDAGGLCEALSHLLFKDLFFLFLSVAPLPWSECFLPI